MVVFLGAEWKRITQENEGKQEKYGSQAGEQESSCSRRMCATRTEIEIQVAAPDWGEVGTMQDGDYKG